MYDQYRQSETYAEVLRGSIDSPLYFMRHVCFGQAFKYPTPAFHYDFEALALDLTLKHVIIEAPRESAKSTWFAVGMPLWHLFCEDMNREGFYPKTYQEYEEFRSGREHKFVVIISKVQEEAVRRVRSIMNVLGNKATGTQSSDFVIHFGDHGDTFATKRNEVERILDNGSVIRAKGTGQLVHGLNENHVRVTYLGNDDAEDENNTRTRSSLEHNFDVFYNGAMGAMAPNGRVFSIGTPECDGCMIHVLRDMAEADPSWAFRHYEALITNNDGSQRSLWPGHPLFTVEALLQEKARDASVGKVYIWYKKRQCRIDGRETQLFKSDDLMLYDGSLKYDDSNNAYMEVTHLGPYYQQSRGAPYELDKPLIVPVNLFQGHDPASGGGGNDACFLTRAYGPLEWRDYGGRMVSFVAEFVCRNDIDINGQLGWMFDGYSQTEDERLPGDEQVDFPGFLTRPVKCIGTEQRYFVEAMEKEVQRRRRATGGYVPFDYNKHTQAKKIYLEGLVAEWRRHEVFVKKHMSKFIDSHLLYRADRRDQFDDPPDAYFNSKIRNFPPTHLASMLSKEGREAHEKRMRYFHRRADLRASNWKTN